VKRRCLEKAGVNWEKRRNLQKTEKSGENEKSREIYEFRGKMKGNFVNSRKIRKFCEFQKYEEIAPNCIKMREFCELQGKVGKIFGFQGKMTGNSVKIQKK
jgi:hypothetical protein